MLRASSTDGERESALRNAGEALPLLNPDVLIELAATLDAHSLSRFPAVCRSWRDAIADSTNALWAPLLQERFPRAFVTLKLLPAAATACYKEIYRDQLAAKQAVHRHSVCPTTCSLSDFVFTFELFRETPVVDPPASEQRAKYFYVDDHMQQYVDDHRLNGRPLSRPVATVFLMLQYDSLPAAAQQPYADREVADKARYKREYAQYEIDMATMWNTSPVVSSWTGNLDALPRRDGEDTSFRVPIRWNDWHQSWESDAQVNPMRMNVLVSRVVNGKLRTLSIMTSGRKCDGDDLVGGSYMHGVPLRCDHIFAHDDHIKPKLHFEFHRAPGDAEGEGADEGQQPWNFEDLTVEFTMSYSTEFISDDSTMTMTKEQLLSFLEHRLRWGACITS
jgi:hypothetical protein